jgi:hypothetical protein
MKLKAALLGFSLFAAATAVQAYFDAEDTFAIENAQTPLHPRDYLPACKSIEKIVSPGFVFYPGKFTFFRRPLCPFVFYAAVVFNQARRNSKQICLTGPTRAVG